MKILLKAKLIILSELIKKNIHGRKSIQSLLFLTLRWLYNKEETRKYKYLNLLTYRALKKVGVNLLRDFALAEFTKDFTLWLSKSDSQKSKTRLAFRIDITKSGKKYGKDIPGLEWLYDYVNECYIKTHEIFLVLVSFGNKNYIMDFVLMRKSNRIGWNNLAQKVINRLIKKIASLEADFKKYCRLSFDGGFGNGTMLQYLSEEHYQYAVVKSGGSDQVNYKNEIINLKKLEEKLALTGRFKVFNKKHNLEGEYCSAKVELINHNIPVKVVLRRFKKKKSKKYRYLLLISSNTNIYDYQIAQNYKLRWGIEECIKECKDMTGIMDYSYHTKGNAKNIESFLALRFIGYMIVNWYQVEHCRPSKTSFWRAAEKIRAQLTQMSYKALWNLFSP